MKSTKIFHQRSLIFFALLVFTPGCMILGFATGGNYRASQQKLAKNVKLYNHEFETHTVGASSMLVIPEERENFLLKIPEIKKRVTFDEVTVVNIEYFKEGKSIKQADLLPKGGFDEAIATIRYDVIILPSSKLQTLVLKQRWVRKGWQRSGKWYVIPDLDAFLSP